MDERIKNIWVALGICLGFLWIAGMAGAFSSHGIAWLDFVGMLASLYCARATRDDTSRIASAARIILMGAAVYVGWLVSLVVSAPAWQTWWNFAFACVYFGFGVAMALNRAAKVGAGEGASTAERIEDEERWPGRAA